MVESKGPVAHVVAAFIHRPNAAHFFPIAAHYHHTAIAQVLLFGFAVAVLLALAATIRPARFFFTAPVGLLLRALFRVLPPNEGGTRPP